MAPKLVKKLPDGRIGKKTVMIYKKNKIAELGYDNQFFLNLELSRLKNNSIIQKNL